MKDKQKLVTIGRFENGFDAELARIALENEGISAMILGGELLVNLPTIYGISICLQVFEEDAENAKRILSEIEREQQTEETEEEEEEDE